MRIVEIHGRSGTSKIAVGESLQNLGEYINKNAARTVIVSDENVERLYGKDFPGSIPVVSIGTGEKIKTLETVEKIYRRLVELGVDRSSQIVAVGGGIVCDVAGFVASTFMRGVDFGFVSSTLLSQVDASVGGKNGVNFLGYKNMIGVFNQPDFVLCDPAMLKTLPKREILSGMAEIVKHAAIGSGSLFSFLEQEYGRALALDAEVVERLVYDSVTIKSRIVEHDETEKGERRKLNFGHTLGHAVEKAGGVTHGEAVSIGMVFAADLSVQMGLLDEADSLRLKTLLRQVGLPVEFSGRRDLVLDALTKDKKRQGTGIHFVLLKSLGEALVREIPLKELREVIYDMCEPGGSRV